MAGHKHGLWLHLLACALGGHHHIHHTHHQGTPAGQALVGVGTSLPPCVHSPCPPKFLAICSARKDAEHVHQSGLQKDVPGGPSTRFEGWSSCWKTGLHV